MPASNIPIPEGPDAARLDWDDLRYLLAVARGSSLSAAARVLRVTHSTVLRRVEAMEAKLAVRLFERLRTGYVCTEAGESLRRAAEQCETLIAQAEREIVGGDTRLTGHVRVTTAHVVAMYLLPAALATFHAHHSQIEVEVRTARARVDLARREADVAIRMSADVPDTLVGRQLGQVRIRVYGWHAAPCLATIKPQSLLPLEALTRDFPWIGFDGQDRSYDRWVDTHVPSQVVVARADHFPSATALIKTGMGISILPEFVASDVPGLRALSEPIPALQSPLWMLTHVDLRNTARVRAFMQIAGNALEAALK
ncbi:LysR family transcriptional regulator [Undibacterium umbellatum]|uniref:LysR family transcriptional regulator n=1 Tax=Undibacterium umbellatum TaxID=2762300 RepID=A0ABR6ZCL4_9BURK|nr:LysR family transcriptional regulator [Undibacterium umbellatum]MBC3909478.1 LysR family transcriptional regulator [Undibacterium umbellatum]